MTQRQVEDATGVSTSTLSRMELGRGVATPLGSWVAVAQAVGEDIFGAAPDRAAIYLDAVARLLAKAGWVQAGRRHNIAWFDRSARPMPGLRHVQLPAERVVVQIVMTVTDIEVERQRLADNVRDVRAATLPGQAVEGLLVVVRSTGSLRRLARTYWRRSTPGWINALRSREARMPSRPGLVWLARRGTHLLPVV